MRLLYIHLAAAIAGVVAAAMASTFPGRAKWVVVVVAAVCAMLNAGAVVAELVWGAVRFN